MVSIESAIRNFYAHQAYLIDRSRHDEWAKTFAPDGEFHSPTYGEPAIGYDNLITISQRFTQGMQENGERHYHIIQNIFIQEASENTAKVNAYILVTSVNQGNKQPSILRLVNIDDSLVLIDGKWVIKRRQVSY